MLQKPPINGKTLCPTNSNYIKGAKVHKDFTATQHGFLP